MKTRIKEIKYGDGICNYKVQTIRNYNSINKKIVIAKNNKLIK
mgnify:CR=1 FL=1